MRTAKSVGHHQSASLTCMDRNSKLTINPLFPHHRGKIRLLKKKGVARCLTQNPFSGYGLATKTNLNMSHKTCDDTISRQVKSDGCAQRVQLTWTSAAPSHSSSSTAYRHVGFHCRRPLYQLGWPSTVSSPAPGHRDMRENTRKTGDNKCKTRNACLKRGKSYTRGARQVSFSNCLCCARTLNPVRGNEGRKVAGQWGQPPRAPINNKSKLCTLLSNGTHRSSTHEKKLAQQS